MDAYETSEAIDLVQVLASILEPDPTKLGHSAHHLPFDSATASPQPTHPMSNLDPIFSHSLPQRSATPSMKPRTPKPATPRPRTGETAALQGSPDFGRPLNVTDALSYLDAVKVQFQEMPDVYNRFLDIMKDFKSQVIDTPGVIERVSMLFHGNPALIQGFNTFLPLGYRIDISKDPSDPNMITVTTPMGTTTQSTTNSFGQVSRPIPGLSSTPHNLPFPGPPNTLPPLANGLMSRSLTPHAYQQMAINQALPPFDMPNAPYSPSFQSTQTTAAASVLGNLNNRNNPVEKQPAGEFNHAIQYLNKIKARYADDSTTYKQFLEILQTYQKEQRHLQDSQVYVQVQMLFKDAPDLLGEFKDFLPEAVPGVAQTGVVILPQPVAPPPMPWAPPDLPASTPNPDSKTAKKPIPPLKRKKRPAEKDPTPVPPAKIAPSRAKKPKHTHKPDLDSPSFSPYVGPQSPPPVSVYAAALPPPPNAVLHSLQSYPSSSSIGPNATTSADKLLFFDRAKKSLENREIYEEFLKLLSLFSRDIIDVKTLVERTRVFLGDGELMSEFKELVGWDERQDNPEMGPPGSIRTGPPEALSALPADDGQGPSYRRLPDNEIKLACSGRDQLCRSVLNDEWVSHPTWASEEAGFVTHKKNSFEDALHKSEEERHEYHVHIEALTRTIALLEPLLARFSEMTAEEKTLFKLKPDLGGPSKCIYHRIIRKIYGRDASSEVLQALQECPSIAVPVVLARLKQKDEEWRRAQRDWSRTWKEVDAKNFYKSLDHQGISFKANDKKNITSKHFMAQIEGLKATEEEKRGTTPRHSSKPLGPQLDYLFDDTSVLHDSLKMIYSFLDHSQATYSPQERRSIEKFLRSFIPLLCVYPPAEFNAACGPLEGGGGHHDDDAHGSGRRSTGGSASASLVHSGPGGVAAGDLRKKLLKTAQEKASVASGSRDNRGVPRTSASASPTTGHQSPTVPHHRQSSPGRTDDIWVTETETLASTDSEHSTRYSNPSHRPFFANTTFYTLLRLLQLLYSRLHACKEIGVKHAANKHKGLLSNPVAIDLGLDDPNGPSAVLAQAVEAVTSTLGEGESAANANVVYMYLLDALEKVFDNELDQATYEEHMRWFFGNKAYHVFTLDKLIIALVKQVQTILSDNKCQELYTLLQNTRNADCITNKDVIRYRREAELHKQDDHLYKVHWVDTSKKLTLELIGPEDPSVDWDGSAEDRWREYVDSYVMDYPTEWIPTSRPVKAKSPLFLRRTFRNAEETQKPVVLEERKMSIRISFGTYKLFYGAESEDYMVRIRGKDEEVMLVERARARHEDRKRCNYLMQV